MKTYLEDEMKRQCIDAEYEKKREELIMYEDAKDITCRDKTHPNTGATPLHVSAAKGYTRVMRVLLQANANVNAGDKDGWTPLHAAAHWEQEEACKILAENGALFDIKNYSVIQLLLLFLLLLLVIYCCFLCVNRDKLRLMFVMMI
jgi:protein phosphatase 1 regulatory subunit 12A